MMPPVQRVPDRPAIQGAFRPVLVPSDQDAGVELGPWRARQRPLAMLTFFEFSPPKNSANISFPVLGASHVRHGHHRAFARGPR